MTVILKDEIKIKGRESLQLEDLKGWQGQQVQDDQGNPIGYYMKNPKGKEEGYVLCEAQEVKPDYFVGDSCKILTCSPSADEGKCEMVKTFSKLKLTNINNIGPRPIQDFFEGDENKAASFFI